MTSSTTNIGALLNPRSVAVVGAAPAGQGLRGRILKTITSHPYAGRIYPISRSHAEVQGVKAYPSVADVPEQIDLAVLIIPAKFVPEELERCGKAGVKAAIILSSGFAEEPGETGRRMQDDIRAIAARYGMAVNGPNSEGFANLDAALCPTFSPAVSASTVPLLPRTIRNGRLAVVAQSGGMGFSFYDRARPKEMALNHVITTGNEACLEIFDMVEFLIDEGKTDAFCLLVEDIKTPDTFRRVAEKALRAGTPLIVNKIGKTDAGARAAASHTAALAGSYASFQALARHYGLVEGAHLEEMVDIAQGFLAWKGKLPAGRRVGISTASGGGGGWLADTCLAHGLEVPTLDDATRKIIDAHLPPYGTSQNPVDGTAQAIRELGYAGLAELVLPSPVIDSVIAVMSGRATEHLLHEKERLTALKSKTDKPVLLWSYTLPVPASMDILAETGLPVFTNMQNAVLTMRHMADWRAHREQFLQAPQIRTERGARYETTAAVLAKAGPVLTEAEAKPLLAAYGIGDASRDVLATTRDSAVAAARAIGAPVALKVQSPSILHKTEAGAVALNVEGPDAVAAAYDHILASAKAHAPDAHVQGVLVQPMAPKGREVILGINCDPHFGPMLMLGLGGIHVEILKDVAFAPVPMRHPEAVALIGRLKGAALLDAHRGAPAADKAALADLIVALSQFAADHAEVIAEIDLNPVIVHEAGNGATIADALIVTRKPTRQKKD
jgi:acyl-CoA synthetase (NDP forming)